MDPAAVWGHRLAGRGTCCRQKMRGTRMRRFLLAMTMALLGVVFTLTAAEAQYRVQPGDLLRVEVLEDPELNRQALVLPDGRIAFPLVGTVPVGGRTLDQVRATLAEALEPNFAVTPSVFVSIARLREPDAIAPAAPEAPPTIRVYGLGELASPGLREVAPGTTILQFLSQAGGMTRFAATRRVQLRRVNEQGQEQVYEIDYRALQQGAPLTSPIVLAEGDVILVPERRLFE
jgi:polysaccharide biosynthesis/export protein